MAERPQKDFSFTAEDMALFEAWARSQAAPITGASISPATEHEPALVPVKTRLGGGKGSAGGAAAEPQKLTPPGRHDRGYTP